MPVDYERIGRIIREARERKGWTLQQLGRRLGVSYETVRLVEAGTTKLPPHKLELYADALDCHFGIYFTSPSDDRGGLLARLAAILPDLNEDKAGTLAALIGLWEPSDIAGAAEPPARLNSLGGRRTQ